MDAQSNARDEPAETRPDVTATVSDVTATVSDGTATVSGGTADGDAAPTVPNETEKRSLEETEGRGGGDDDEEGERKKCKTDGGDRGVPESMSKTQWKKLQKKQKWLEGQPRRKLMRKQKQKEKLKLKRLMREYGMEVQEEKTCNKMAESTCKQRIVLDLSYNHLMSDKDLQHCSNQLLGSYAVNRRMDNPMQFYVSSFEGKFKEVMSIHRGFENWDIHYLESSFDKNFKKEEIVYLTSDSSNVLDIVDESKVYIIGGLVDHNSCKGASVNVAKNLGVAHARLPVNEYINMKTRNGLTLNQVFEIMSKVVSGASWREALISTIPKRKMFSAKDDEIRLDYMDCVGYGHKEKKTCPVDEEKDDDNFPVINKK